MSNRNLKTVFPLTEAYGTRIQQALHANTKKCFSAPPPNGDKTPPYIPDFTDTVIYLHEQFLSLAAPEIQEGIDMSRFPDENAQFCERIFWQSDFNFVWLRL